MFEDLPSESQIAEMLLRELTDDLRARVDRLRFLIALDQDFGSGALMLPGGEVSHFAYVEARSSFVAGNYLSAVLAAQCFVENMLGGHLVIDETVRPIHGQSALASGPVGKKPQLRQLIDKGVESGIISSQQANRIEQLATIRNPLMHFRDIDDPAQLGRRVLNERTHAVEIIEADARFAITTIIELASNSGAVIGCRR